MSQELLDALAARLWDAGRKSPFESGDDMGMRDASFMARVAAEALRQMRWARETETKRCTEVAASICVMPKGGQRCGMCAACEVVSVLFNPWPHDKGEFPAPELTLAPEDWTP